MEVNVVKSHKNQHKQAAASPRSEHDKAPGQKPFSLTLERAVTLNRYPMIARLTFLRERKDLVSLLTAMQKNPDDMPVRLKDYLVKEKLWDTNTDHITGLGIKVISTGMFATTERGFYHIWYTNNDPLLATRPVFVQRDTAFFEPKAKLWKKGVDATDSEFKLDGADTPVQVLEEIYQGARSQLVSTSMSLAALDPEVICFSEKTATVSLTWKLDFLSSAVSLAGQLETLLFNGNKPSNQPHELNLTLTGFSEHLPDIMNEIAQPFAGVWHHDCQRLAIGLEQIRPYFDAVQKFALASYNNVNLDIPSGVFSKVTANGIPVQPQNQQDAEAWQNFWLESFYDNAYQPSQFAHEKQAEWLDHPALQSFELSLKQHQALLHKLSRTKLSSAYWHIAAMADLTPSQSKEIRMPVSLVDKELFDLEQLMQQLSGGKAVETIIYSDRYVHTARQSRNLIAVARCFADASGRLLTLAAPKGREALLRDDWQRVIFEKKNDNHGRFWIFIYEGYARCWECTNGLDFFKEEQDNYVVDGYPTFIPKEETELPQYLKRVVNELKSREVA